MSFLSKLNGDIRASVRRWRDERNRRIEEAKENARRRAAEQAERERQSRFLYGLGNDFEDTVASMFDPESFELIHRTPRHDDDDGRYVRGMAYPDLRFVEKSSGRSFWVECKFRAHVGPKWEIEWCNRDQLTRYKRTMHQYREPVLIVIGVGGTAQHPERIYCLNLDRVNFTTLYYGTYKDNRLHGRVTDLDGLLARAG